MVTGGVGFARGRPRSASVGSRLSLVAFGARLRTAATLLDAGTPTTKTAGENQHAPEGQRDRPHTGQGGDVGPGEGQARGYASGEGQAGARGAGGGDGNGG